MELSGVDLFPLIWIPNRFRTVAHTTLPLIKSTLAACDSLCKTKKWHYNSPLMRLTGHDYFPPGNMDPRFRNWISDTPLLLHQVITDTGILPISRLITKSPISFMDQWKYHQLSQFVKSLPQPLRSETELNPIESLLVGDLSNPFHTFIKLYCLYLLFYNSHFLLNGSRSSKVNYQTVNVSQYFNYHILRSYPRK